jgi:peptidylprolyl isomerase
MRTLLAIALFATACSGNGGADILNADYAPFLNVDFDQSTLLPNGEFVRDFAIGTGAPVLQGQTLSVNFTAWLPDGTVVGSSDVTGSSDFVLGAPGTIAGINQGLGGMNVGGTRQLVIPPELAYGDQGSGPVPGNAIIVYQLAVISAQ